MEEAVHLGHSPPPSIQEINFFHCWGSSCRLFIFFKDDWSGRSSNIHQTKGNGSDEIDLNEVVGVKTYNCLCRNLNGNGMTFNGGSNPSSINQFPLSFHYHFMKVN